MHINYSKLFSTTNAEASAFAVRTTTAMLVTTFLAFVFQFSAPYWAPITAIALMSSYAGLAVQKGIYRVIGTIAGAVIALIFARYVNDIYSLLLVVFFTIFIFQYLSEVSAYRYAFILCGATIFLVFGSIVSGPEIPMQMAVWRCAEILLGVIVVSIVAVCVLPKDPGYWLHQEILNFFSDYNKLYHQIISENLTEKQGNAAIKNLMNLSATLTKIKNHYDAYCQEPSRDLYHVNAMGELINTLKKLQNALKLMSMAFAIKQEYFWISMFKENIEQFSKMMEEIFFQLSQSPQHILTFDSKLLTIAQNELDTIKNKVTALRATHEMQNYAVFDNQVLYVFLIHQQQLIDLLQVFTEDKIFDVQAANEFKFSNIASFKKDPIIIRHAIKTALACTLAMFIWIWADWPGGLQGIVSAIVIATNIYIDDMWQHSFRRIIGCVLGGAIGLISLHFLIYNVFDLLIILVVAGFIFAFYTSYSKKYSYVFLQANVVFTLAMVQAGGPTDSIAAPLGRLSGIILGIIAIMMVNHLIWPLNGKKLLFQKVKQLSKNFSENIITAKNTLLQQDFSRIQTELAECNKIYASISSALSDDNPNDKKLKQQLAEIDFALINLNVILQYANLPQAFAVAEKINLDLKGIMIKALSLLQIKIKHPELITSSILERFEQLIVNEYKKVREAKRNFDYSIAEAANLSYVVYQLWLLVEEHE